jgi:hypothetical protein
MQKARQGQGTKEEGEGQGTKEEGEGQGTKEGEGQGTKEEGEGQGTKDEGQLFKHRQMHFLWQAVPCGLLEANDKCFQGLMHGQWRFMEPFQIETSL